MRLTEYLLRSAPTVARMDLIHCTNAGNGFEIFGRGELSPTPCLEYGADLLYLFYGRPAYKPGARIGASANLDLAPIALVIDTSVLEAAVRMVPFDSGAFPRYEPLIGPGLKRTDFELAGDPTLPLRLVRAFYHTNRSYYDQQPGLLERDIAPSVRAARAYARLIADTAIRDTDDRLGTIELQFSQSIPLAEALRAIIAPSQMLDDPEVLNALAMCPEAAPISYKTYGRFDPLSFAHTLYERVDTFLESRGAFA